MSEISLLLLNLAAVVSADADIGIATLQERIGLDPASATQTKTSNGDFMLSGARFDFVPGLVDVLVTMPPRRSIVIAPEMRGAMGALHQLPDFANGECVESRTGLGFVWRAPLDGVTIGLSASLPDRTIQTIFCDAFRD